MFSALIDSRSRWLVGSSRIEHVRLLQHDAAEQQPRRLAARKRLGRLEPFFAAEQHLAEQAVNVLPRRVGVEPVQPLDRGHPLLDRAGVVLRKVADRDLVPPAHLARVDVRGVAGMIGRIRQQRLQQRRLAGAVAADEDDLLAAIDDGVEAGNDAAGRRSAFVSP